MSINRRFSLERNSAFVSWWGGAAMHKGHYLPEKDRTFLDDLDGEKGYVPDHIIVVDNLSGMKMQAAWNEIRNKKDAHYRGYYKNCSTIVARVLRAGSSKGSAWHRHSHIWSPLKVKRLAYSMGGSDISWKEFLRDYFKSAGITKDEHLQMHKLKKRTTGHGTCSVASRFDKGLDTGMPAVFVGGMQIGECRDGSTVFRRT